MLIRQPASADRSARQVQRCHPGLCAGGGLRNGWRRDAGSSAADAGLADAFGVGERLVGRPSRPSEISRPSQPATPTATGLLARGDGLSRAMTSSAWRRGQTGSRTANSTPPQRQRMSNVAELTVPGRRRFEQQSIAGLVAVRVVERLEVVDVEQRDGQRLTGSPRSRQLAGELLIPAAAVGQPCQRLRSRRWADRRAGEEDRAVGAFPRREPGRSRARPLSAACIGRRAVSRRRGRLPPPCLG